MGEHFLEFASHNEILAFQREIIVEADFPLKDNGSEAVVAMALCPCREQEFQSTVKFLDPAVGFSLCQRTHRALSLDLATAF